jgi:hypothetical protein
LLNDPLSALGHDTPYAVDDESEESSVFSKSLTSNSPPCQRTRTLHGGLALTKRTLVPSGSLAETF